MKKILSILMVLAVLVSSVMAFSAFAADEDRVITVNLDGEAVKFDVPPQLIDGRTMVPLRAIFEALDAEVTWDDATQTAKAVKGETAIAITINEKILHKNDEDIILDVPAMLINQRTLVPLRAISESLDVKVGWDDATSTVSLTSKKVAELKAENFAAGNGFKVSGKDGAPELSESDRAVTVATTDAGVTVSHGGYYVDGENWGGVALKEKYVLDGFSVKIKFDKVPEVVTGEDCWASVCFLSKPELFKVAKVTENPGFMNLIRFANNKWEIYDGITKFANIKMLETTTNMYSLKSGDEITVSVKLVNGFYTFTYENGANSETYTYESEEFTKLFEDGKAHLVVAASCNGTQKDAFQYTISEVSYY